MKNVFKSVLWSCAMAATVFLYSCDNEDDPIAFTLVSLTAGDIDLNGATTATGVPADASIVATFSKEVSASDLEITLLQDYDDANFNITTSVDGSTVTITTEGLGSGALYELNLAKVVAADGDLLPATGRTFSTAGFFVPAGTLAYWPFDGDANDAIGSFDPSASGIVALTFGEGVDGNANSAGVFDGDATIVEIPNGDQLMNTSDFTLSFWVKLNPNGHVDAGGNPAGHFVMGLGAFNGFQMEIPSNLGAVVMPVMFELEDGSTRTGGNLFFNGDGIFRDNGGWEGSDFRADLTASGGVAALLTDKWALMTYVFNSATKQRQLYIDGELMQSDNFSLLPEGTPERSIIGLKYAGVAPDVVNELAFGFVQSRAGTMWDAEPWGGYDFPTANHFKGSLDEVRIFHKTLTADEIRLMYESVAGN